MGTKRHRRAPKLSLEGRELDLTQKLALESDRGCVLVAAAAMDGAVDLLLRHFLEKTSHSDNDNEMAEYISFLMDREPLPPLGNFGVRIRLCRVLGLFPLNTYEHLKTLSSLRNIFAHIGQPVELTPQDVSRFTDPSQWPAKVKKFHRDVKRICRSVRKDSDSRRFSEPRFLFMTICVALHYEMFTHFTGALALDHVEQMIREMDGLE